MVAYNFQAQFAPDVESGRKRQTIRRDGKRRHARPGEAVQLYTGMRTKGCRQLGTGICTTSTYCAIREDGITLGNHPKVNIAEFARADGFRDFDHMKQWFRETHGLPFTGRLIAWEPQSS
ncbi:ASCH domain-containing protein [Marinibacterium profundimaris]|uniref:Uncharacterized protein n=1 Tax=Marinibacterium profundimaris TaxID=1679460 RepID=A0A225NS02_9RHOB|nr:hypothetical protein [Marinibacterium profundimaris]OWU77625.1 hypothetical protein ATO3_02790 [Marinibacterium profundimaris]